MTNEPQIIINNILLTETQVITIRVAIENLAMKLSNMVDKEEIEIHYLNHINEIRKIMMMNLKRK